MSTLDFKKNDENAMNLIRPDTSLNRTLLLSPVGVRINQVLLYIMCEYEWSVVDKIPIIIFFYKDRYQAYTKRDFRWVRPKW